MQNFFMKKLYVCTEVLCISDSNPASGKISISLWLRVVAPQSSQQRVFATGSTSWDTGFSLQVKDSAKLATGRMIKSNNQIYKDDINVHDTLTTWSHIVLTADCEGTLNVLCKQHWPQGNILLQTQNAPKHIQTIISDHSASKIVLSFKCFGISLHLDSKPSIV